MKAVIQTYEVFIIGMVANGCVRKTKQNQFYKSGIGLTDRQEIFVVPLEALVYMSVFFVLIFSKKKMFIWT